MKVIFDEHTNILVDESGGMWDQGNRLGACTVAQFEENTGVLLVEHSIWQDDGYEIDCDEKHVSRMESLLRPRSLTKAVREAVNRADTWIEHTREIAAKIQAEREAKAKAAAERAEVECPY